MLCPRFLLWFWQSLPSPKSRGWFLPLAENEVKFVSLEALPETLWRGGGGGRGEMPLYFLHPLCHFGLEHYLFLVHLNTAEGRGSCNMAYLHHAVSSWQLTRLSENRTSPLRMWVLLKPVSGETSSRGWEDLARLAGRFVFLRCIVGIFGFFLMSQRQERAMLPPTFSSFPTLLRKKRGEVATWDQHVLVFPLVSRWSSLPHYKNKNL